MSVSSVYVREIAQGDGVNTVFGFPWKFVAASDLMVYVDDVLQPASTYEVKNPITKDRGEIVFRTAPAVGAVVVIRRMDNQQQTRLFKNQENFNAHEVEKAFDKLTLLVQEGFEELRRGALCMQSQSNLDYSIESLTIDDGMLALDLANKTYKQTSFTQAQVQKVIDDAVRSVDLSVKNMAWDGNSLVLSLADNASKKGVVSENVVQIRAQHDDNNNWWLEWSLDGKVWESANVYTKAEVNAALSTKADISALTAEITRATNAESALSGRITTNADAITQLESEVETKASVTEVNTIKTDLGDLGDQVHGIEEKIPGKASATNQLATMADIQQAGGLSEVLHDDTMTGNGTSVSPLSVKTDDFVKKSATEMQTLSSPLTIKDKICLTDPDDNVAKHSLSIVAGIPTETAEDMDIIGNRKFDTLPTTDDATAYADLNPKSMITKGQVASAVETKADKTTVDGISASVTALQNNKADKTTNFITPITSTNKGATKTEIDALDEKIDIAGTSGKIIGSYWFGKTKASTVVPAPTLVGQNYYDFTTGQVYKSTDGATWTLDSTNTPPTDIDAQVIISSKFWDITEQENQHGGKAWWSHTNSEWSYSPTIYEDKPAGGASLPLLTPIFADHQLNDESYLNADTFSWQAGSVYEAVYQHLVEDVNNSAISITLYAWFDSGYNRYYYTKSDTPQSGDTVYDANMNIIGDISSGGSGNIDVASADGEHLYFADRSSGNDLNNIKYFDYITHTIDNISIKYITAADGHRICLPDQETAISQLHAKTGVAWFYILDTENARFKLPRTKFAFTGLRDVVGDYVAPGVPNITGDVNIFCPWQNSSSNGALSTTSSRQKLTYNNKDENGTYINRLYFDASSSNSIYGNSTTVQPPATEMYLYFYVGNFTKTATENTAGLNAELFNNKVDLDLNNISAGGSNKIINTVFPDWDNAIEWNFTTNYHAPEDGWVFFKGNGISYDLYKEDETTVIIVEFLLSSNYTSVMQPISKGQYLKYRSGSAQYSRMLFVPCKNHNI